MSTFPVTMTSCPRNVPLPDPDDIRIEAFTARLVEAAGLAPDLELKVQGPFKLIVVTEF